VALVAGATRGCGRAIAVELGRAGAYVYATGRSSREHGRSEMDRPETIEETGDLIRAARGTGQAVRVDHLDIEAVRTLVEKIRDQHGRLDVLVNDIFGGDRYAEWNRPLWRHDLNGGLRMLQMGVHTHLITLACAVPLILETGAGLVVEMTDGTHEYNRGYRQGVGPYYDLVKANVERIMTGVAVELESTDTTAVAVTPGWIRSEAMLEAYGVTEATWRDTLETTPGFAISESPTFVARGVAALAADPGRGRFAGQVLTSHGLAVEYDHTDVDGSRPDCWGHMAAGSPDPIEAWR
jgi:NAD(P)-dependent dehydrogenase (short-subunit alcohol dehydrogenase family)